MAVPAPQDLSEAEPGQVHDVFSWKLLALGITLLLASLMVVLALTITLVAKMTSFSGSTLQLLQADQYYTLLVPLTVPVTITTVFLNWLSMKLFKHNS